MYKKILSIGLGIGILFFITPSTFATRVDVRFSESTNITQSIATKTKQLEEINSKLSYKNNIRLERKWKNISLRLLSELKKQWKQRTDKHMQLEYQSNILWGIADPTKTPSIITLSSDGSIIDIHTGTLIDSNFPFPLSVGKNIDELYTYLSQMITRNIYDRVIIYIDSSTGLPQSIIISWNKNHPDPEIGLSFTKVP